MLMDFKELVTNLFCVIHFDIVVIFIAFFDVLNK